MKIEDDKESVIETREVPADKLEAQVAQLPDREACRGMRTFSSRSSRGCSQRLSDGSTASFADQYAPGHKALARLQGRGRRGGLALPLGAQ